MRLMPPKTRKKVFRGEKEIRAYFLKHTVIGGKDPILITDYIKQLIEEKGKIKAFKQLMEMVPDRAHYRASCIFYEYIEDNF